MEAGVGASAVVSTVAMPVVAGYAAAIALGSRGLRGTAVTPQPARWAALWQVVNAEGEEYLSPALANDGTELPLRSLPAGPLRLLTEDLPGWTASLGPRPSTEETADSIVDAARATFDKADADVVLVRLVAVRHRRAVVAGIPDAVAVRREPARRDLDVGDERRHRIDGEGELGVVEGR